jgi:hypothetical protein
MSNHINTRDFTEEELADLPQLAEGQEWSIPETELQSRRDLRPWCIFSIDPSSARCGGGGGVNRELGFLSKLILFYTTRGAAI